MRERGFTLVEVLVAMVVLEVGLLGVVGTLVLAARNLRKAASLERAVTEATLVFDSVSGFPAAAQGTRSGPWGRVHWTLSADGALRMDVSAGSDSARFAVLGRTTKPSSP